MRYTSGDLVLWKHCGLFYEGLGKIGNFPLNFKY